MNKKLLLAMLTLAVSVSMIVGGTMAWFTSEDDAGNAVFTAGTVEVTAGDATITGSALETNVNPGDSFEVEWEIENDGTKNMVFGTSTSAVWSGLDSALFTDENDNEETMENLTLSVWDEDENDFVEPNDGTPVTEGAIVGDWLVTGSGNDINNYAIYYVGSPIASGDSVTLKLQIDFDGPLTHNGYQGAVFTMGGSVTAVQSSNNAPFEVLGLNYYDGLY